SGNGVIRAYTYNARGQVATLTETITGAGAKTFTYTYDRFGRLRTQLYPDGLKVQQLYDADGVHAQTSISPTQRRFGCCGHWVKRWTPQATTATGGSAMV